ncbi:TetR/AcrR family transcriptional regulator [Lichenihabitans psoromatis]|uniref:TetR/AcrR family transcriptional regulator n=1 Tax=Lichenihabitans psoromatis TaxID=2528642 RepID=UPI001036994C
MVVKRIQGRPVRGEGDVGRGKLIEAARSLLRAPSATDISRKAVAEAAGVTPALVSYYFRDKESLLAAATQPVIDARITQLKTIMATASDATTTLRALVILFIDSNRQDHQIIEHHLRTSWNRNDASLRSDATVAAYDSIVRFFNDGADAGAWSRFDVRFFIIALWGLCRGAAQTLGPGEPISALAMEERADFVMNLVLHGITSSGSNPIAKPKAD